MPKKKSEPAQAKYCVRCGRSFNLIQQEDDIWKCTTCLAEEDERKRHGLPIESLNKTEQNKEMSLEEDK